MQQKLSKLQMFIIWCSGKNFLTLLKSTSTEIGYAMTEGMLVLIPAVLAFITTIYGMQAVEAPPIVTATTVVFLSTIILVVDRGIMSYTREISGKIIAMRVALATILSLVVSTLFTIEWCNDVIVQEQAQELIMKQDSIIAKYDEQIFALDSAIIQEVEKLEEIEMDYINEGNGLGKSGEYGFGGPSTAAERERFHAARERYDTLVNKNEAKIQVIENRKKAEVATAAKAKASGFVGMITSLNKTKNKDKTVRNTLWIIHLLFWCIDLLPLTLKLTKKKRMDLYYSKLDHYDKLNADSDAMCRDIQLCKYNTIQAIEIETEIMNHQSYHDNIRTEVKTSGALEKLHQISKVLRYQVQLESIIESTNDADLKTFYEMRLQRIIKEFLEDEKDTIINKAA